MATCIFIGAHADDETLMMGASIANHVNNGHTVFVATITDGAADSLASIWQGMGLTQSSFATWRTTERNAALTNLRATPLEATGFSPNRLKDGTLNPSNYFGNDIRSGHLNMAVVDRVRNVIQQAASRTGVAVSAVRVKTHSHNEQHPDHMAVCAAVLYLKDLGEIVDVTLYAHIAVWYGPNGQWPSAATLGGIQENCPQVIWLRDALLSYCDGSTMLGGMYYGFAQYGIGHATADYAFPIAWDGQRSYYLYPPAVIKDTTSGVYDNMPVQKVTVATPLYTSASTGSTVLMNMGVGECIVTKTTTSGSPLMRQCIGGKVDQTNMIEGYIIDNNCAMARPATYPMKARVSLPIYSTTAKTTVIGTVPAGYYLKEAGGSYAADVMHAYDGGKLIKIAGYKATSGGTVTACTGYVLTNWTSGSIASYNVYFG